MSSNDKEQSPEKHIDIKKILTLDWQSGSLVRTANSEFGFFNKIEKTLDPLKDGWRIPWDNVDYTELYKMKYHVSIQPDPNCGWMTSVNDLKLHNSKLRAFLLECKKYLLFKNIILVYEYGKNGKEYGKVHWHILLSSNKIGKFHEEVIKHFGTNTSSRWKNTVVIKPITLDRALSCHATDEQKVNNYHEQIDHILKKYFKKESQNRRKCLYTNMIKKT